MKPVWTIFLSLILLLATACARPVAQRAMDEVMRLPKSVTGKVVAIDKDSLTLEMSEKKGAAPQQMTFMINQDTKMPADIGVGFEATVDYGEEAGRNIATLITAKAPPLYPARAYHSR